jgi:Zn finger protein HypA/HybF involved in hydrogenase expression
MYKVVSAMHTRLSVAPGEKGGKFHDTLVSNVQDMIALVPKLNLTNDPEITRISVEMSALTKVSPDTLRSSVEVRAATAAKAAAIAKSMAAYIGA